MSRHSASTSTSRSMQDIVCAVEPVPLSPTAGTEHAQIEQTAVFPIQDEPAPEIYDHRLALEQEVANLTEKLTHEIKLREALQGGLQRSPGTLPKIPGYIPAKMRELLFEVAVMEEEVTFLEKHAVYLQQELGDKGGLAAPPFSNLNDQKYNNSIKPPTLKIDIPEFSEPLISAQPLEPVTPLLTPTTPLATPSPRAYGHSFASSPSLIHERNVPLPLPVPPAFASPLPMPPPSPVHDDESNNVPPQTLNRKRVIRRGSSSSESIPADFGEQSSVVGKPSRKKPNHKKSASLTFASMKVDFEGDTSFTRPATIRKDVDREDVYRRLSTPKNGGHMRGSSLSSPAANSDSPGSATLRRSKSSKEFQCKHPSLTSSPALQCDGSKDSLQRPTIKKELHGRSPPIASPQFENKGGAFIRRTFSNKERQVGTSPVSNPSPTFEDKRIASLNRTLTSVMSSASPQMKFEDCNSLPLTPTPEKKEVQDLFMTPIKLPPTMEKENIKIPYVSDERQRTHDLVISRSLPRIKLNKGSNSVSSLSKTLIGKSGLQQRQTTRKDGEKNNFSENAKLYVLANTRPKHPGTPTKQGFKVRSVQVHKSISRVVDKPPTSKQMEEKKFESTSNFGVGLFHKDDKDDKVEMVCGPLADAAWLSEDLSRLLGTVCGKIRWATSGADPVASRLVVKPPLPQSASSQRIVPHQRSQSFNIRSSGGLKLLQECCSDGMDLSDSYEVHKRRTEDVGPHRHYYKGIRLPLDQKLKI